MPIDPKRLPSWSEFLFAAGKQGIGIFERELVGAGPRGSVLPIRYLQRKDGMKVIVAPLPSGEILQEPYFSNLCRRLQFDPAALGIRLDELEPETED